MYRPELQASALPAEYPRQPSGLKNKSVPEFPCSDVLPECAGCRPRQISEVFHQCPDADIFPLLRPQISAMPVHSDFRLSAFPDCLPPAASAPPRSEEPGSVRPVPFLHHRLHFQSPRNALLNYRSGSLFLSILPVCVQSPTGLAGYRSLLRTAPLSSATVHHALFPFVPAHASSPDMHNLQPLSAECRLKRQ